MAPAGSVVCFGGAAVDRGYRLAAAAVTGTSNPATARLDHGGVARNVAETLARLGTRCSLVTALGDDAAGRDLRAGLAALGVDTAGSIVVAGAATAEYVAVTSPDGDLVLGVAAMAVLDRLDAALVASSARLAGAGLVFADCNADAGALAALIGRASPFRLAVDAVSTAKAQRLPGDLAGVDVLFLNGDEAAAMLAAPPPPDDAAAVWAAGALVARGARAVVLTQGAAGAVVAEAGRAFRVPAAPARVADVTGAGDALVAGTLARLAAGAPLDAAVRFGSALAALTLEAAASVRRDLPDGALAAAAERRSATMPPNRPL